MVGVKANLVTWVGPVNKRIVCVKRVLFYFIAVIFGVDSCIDLEMGTRNMCNHGPLVGGERERSLEISTEL